MALIAIWCVAWGVQIIFRPVCITGQKIRVWDQGLVMTSGGGQQVFSGRVVNAFLLEKHKDGHRSNSLVFGSCSSRLIKKIRYRLVLEEAIIESTGRTKREKGEENDWFGSRRQILQRKIEAMHSPASSGVLQGLVLGSKEGLSEVMVERMTETGTIHLMVASGFNILLVAGICVWLCAPWLGRMRAIYVSVAVAVWYAFLSGFEPPVVRAVLMYTVVAGAWLLGRGGGGQGLWWAVGVMVVFDPWIVWEVGFQLSVAATYGLVVFKPALDRWVAKRWGEGFLEGFGEWSTTVAAFVFTTPIVWWHFGRVVPRAVLVNVMLTSLVPVLTVLGFVEVALLSFKLPLGGIVSLGSEIMAQTVIWFLYLW